MEKRKQEEKPVIQKKPEPTLTKQDQDKIKKLAEENIKMKLRVQQLLDSIGDLQKEINRNFDRFKAFIMNSNISDEMKKTLLNQAESLLKPNLEKKVKIKKN